MAGIERFKARMVVRGFTQIKGEDYRRDLRPCVQIHHL